MPRDLSATVRSNVIRLRELRLWSRADLHRASGISESSLSLFERGERSDLALDTLGRLARALQVSPEMLLAPHTESELAEAAARPVLSAAEVELLARWRALSQEQQGALRGYLDRLIE